MSKYATGLSPEDMATEVAFDLHEGMYVNLGIGLPSLVADVIPPSKEVILHTENGVLGMGPPPPAGAEDWDLINAGKAPVTLRPGGSYMSHADSFAIVRGGHLDLSVMGGLQVSPDGDLANWSDRQGVPGVGGAMDLAQGARRVAVMMRHNARSGEPKLVQRCSLPLTGRGVVWRLYTDVGIFEPRGGYFAIRGLAGDVSLQEARDRTAAPLVAEGTYDVLPRVELRT